MSDPAPSVVFDCVIYTQAMISSRGPAAQCLAHALDGTLLLVWSDYVLQEIRELPAKLPARLKVTPERVETFILSIAPHVRHVSVVQEIYTNPFDRDDSHYVNLALVSGAKLITSRDTDLLRLMDLHCAEGVDFRGRFPDLAILTPEELLSLLRSKPPGA